MLDTNVLVAAILARGLCQALFDRFIESETLVIVSSDEMLAEFERVMAEKTRGPSAEISRVVDVVRRRGLIVRPATIEIAECRDPDDLIVLGTAVAAEAGAVVTGDADLLVVKNFRGILVESPRAFYDRVL